MASQNGTKFAHDPAASVPGAPPNLGEPVMPHVMSFAGIVSNLAKVYRPSDEAVMFSLENARFMRNDIVIMECIEARQRCGALLDWHIEPEDEKHAGMKQVAEEVTRIIESMPRFMQYRENLANATFFGKYGAAHTWRKKMVRRQMRTAVTKWTPIHGDKIVFRFDDARKVFDDSHIGIRCGLGITSGSQIGQDWQAQSIQGGSGGGMMPTDQGLAYFLPKWQRSLIAIHKHQIEDGEFEAPQYAGRIHGVGIRSRVFWTWMQKQETLAWLMDYLERSAAGFEIWGYQWGNPESERATRKAAQERISGRNIVLVPMVPGENGTSTRDWYDRIEPSMAGADAMKNIACEYFGQLIKRYILGQTLTTEAAGTGLGSNLADVHMDTFMQIIKYDCRLLEETITDDLVRHIIRYNFPAWVNYDFKFKIKTEEDDVSDRLEAAKAAYEMGLRIPAKKIYELTAITPPEEGEETLSMSQAQAGQQPPGAPGADPRGAAGAGGLPPGMTARFGADLQAKLGQALQTTGPDSANGANQNANGANEDYAAKPIDANGFDRAAFRRGLAAEMRETKDHTLASEIVLDNLQRDPRHYDMQALMAGNTGDGLLTPPSQDSERSRLATYWKESEHPRADDGEFMGSGGANKARTGANTRERKKLPGLPSSLKERKFSWTGGGDLDKPVEGQYKPLKGQKGLFGEEEKSKNGEILHKAMQAGKINTEQAATAQDWSEEHGHDPDWHVFTSKNLWAENNVLIGRVDRGDDAYAVQIEDDGKVSVYDWPGYGENAKKSMRQNLKRLGDDSPEPAEKAKVSAKDLLAAYDKADQPKKKGELFSRAGLVEKFNKRFHELAACN